MNRYANKGKETMRGGARMQSSSLLNNDNRNSPRAVNSQ
jgi:hypothetical protein